MSRVMLPLMLVLFISTVDQTIVATALGRMGEILGDMTNAPWIATSYLLTSAISTLILGKLGDMIGRKSVFQTSVAIFTAGSALCAFAPTMGWLIVFRAVQGIGGGGLNSLVMAIVGDLASPRDRARYQAVLGIVPAVAIVFGPILGGLIIDNSSWGWIFLINVPVGMLAFSMIASRLHLPAVRRAHRLDLAGAVLSTLFTTSFLLIAVNGGAAYAWGSWQILALACLSIVTLSLFLIAEKCALEPITPLSLFSSSIFSISSALFFISTAALFVGMLFVPLMLQTVFKYSATGAGASIIPLLLGLIIATMVAGTVMSRTGRYKFLPILGSVLSAFGFYALSKISMSDSLSATLLAVTVLGVGLGLFIQVAVLAGQNAVDHRHLGAATGALNFFKTLGGAVGSALFGALLADKMQAAASAEQTLAAFHMVFSGAIVLSAIAFLLALLLKEKPMSAEMIEVAEGRVNVPEY